MLKKEGSINKSNFITSRRAAFLMNISSVRSNITPISNIRLKKEKPMIKEKSISLRI